MQKCTKVPHSASTFFALNRLFSCFSTLKMSEKRWFLGVQNRPFWVPLFHPLFRTYQDEYLWSQCPYPNMISCSLAPLGSHHVTSHDGIFGTWQIHEKPWKIMLKTWFFRFSPVLPKPEKVLKCKTRNVQSQKCSKVPHSSLTLFH